MSDQLTIEQFQAALPKHVKKAVSQEMVDSINTVIGDPSVRESYRENLLTYSMVLQEGKYKLQNYLEAVKYVSFKMYGASDMKAWEMTFPDRYQSYVAKKVEAKHIASVVSAYNRGQLVNKVFEQTIIPTHILNAGVHQEAINQLAHLMINAKSEKVQGDCAAKLADVLKLPEVKKIELDIGLKEDHSISELRETTLQLVEQQKKMIENGVMTTTQVAHSKLSIIEGEVTDDASADN